MTISTVSPSIAWLTSFRTKRVTALRLLTDKPKLLACLFIVLYLRRSPWGIAGALSFEGQTEGHHPEFQLMTTFHQRLVFDHHGNHSPSLPRAAARVIGLGFVISCKYSLILVFIDLVAGYQASLFYLLVSLFYKVKIGKRHCPDPILSTKGTIKIIAINNLKKSIIAVKPLHRQTRALLNVQTSRWACVKTLLDWFCWLHKIAIIINTDNTSKIVVNARSYLKTP